MTKEIKILYEDPNVLAIEKPSGIFVHGDGRSKQKTIADWIIKKYPKIKNVGESQFFDNKKMRVEIKKPGIVHRLDTETSGALLIAKTSKAYEFLKQQFKERLVKKTYVAIVSGHVKNDRGVINKPIGRSPKDFRRWLAGRGSRGTLREAITEYKVIKRFTNKKGAKFTYLEIKPKTGRTHQIRVHMKFLNHPVVCDSLYNPGAPCPKGIYRLALHAKKIEFKNLKGKTVTVESNVPREFLKVVK
ncbi:MAG: RluA family pseudouridine synthase [Minisyncoccia bacterium]